VSHVAPHGFLVRLFVLPAGSGGAASLPHPRLWCTVPSNCGPLVVIFDAQVARPFARFYPDSQYGGIAILERVANNAAALGAWTARARARHGDATVAVHTVGNASQGADFVWVVLDKQPACASCIGIDMSSDRNVRLALQQLAGMSADVASRSTVVSALGPAPVATSNGSEVGFSALHAVLDDDPVQYVAVATIDIGSFTTGVVGRGAVGLDIADHTGSVAGPWGGCSHSSSRAVIPEDVVVSTSPPQNWVVNIYQCPEYERPFLTPRKVATYPAVVAAGTALLIAAFFVFVHIHDQRWMYTLALAKHEESTRAHRCRRRDVLCAAVPLRRASAPCVRVCVRACVCVYACACACGCGCECGCECECECGCGCGCGCVGVVYACEWACVRLCACACACFHH
jgi:hypothetical protein